MRTVLAVFSLLVILVLALTPDPSQAEPPVLLPADQRATLVTIDKGQRLLTLWRGKTRVKRYRIALGFAPKGDKLREGDGKTPLGRYTIDRRNSQSSFHLSLGIDYPRPEQQAKATEEGRDPGGDIFIHGQPNGWKGPTLAYDWTHGCAAVSNAEMREIWSHVAVGTPVLIRP